MLKLNDSIIRKRVSSGLVKGNILRTNLFTKKNNKPQFERIILLNNNFNQEDIYYVMTTSRVKWYKRNWNRMKYCSLFIEKGTIDIFKKATVINCREVNKLTKQNLIDRYMENMLEFLGVLPEDILKKVLKCLVGSRLIKSKILKEII